MDKRAENNTSFAYSVNLLRNASENGLNNRRRIL